MKRLPRRVIWQVFLRSFAIQGSWNYRTLQGSGFAYALMPVLRWVHGDGEQLQEAVARHRGLFNAHPYLAGIALGAVARMEIDGEDPALMERFKAALRGSLGTLGDRLVWAGWRPACVLLGILVLLTTHSAAAGVLSFLVVYNTGHLALRWWALRVGFAGGRNVGEQLRAVPVARWHGIVVTTAAFLLGAVLPLIAAGESTADRVTADWLLAPGAAALAGWFAGPVARVPALIFLAVVAIAGFLVHVFS